MHFARMTGHDYREDHCFVTVNTAPRRNCLSRTVDGKVELLPFGEIVLKAYLKIEADSPEIDLRICAIVPDHLHLNNDWVRLMATTRSRDELAML